MMDNEKIIIEDYYLNRDNYKSIINERNVYVFGICIESDDLVRYLGDINTVNSFVDNNKCGDNNYYLGKRILSLEKCVAERKVEPIIIVTTRYAKTIEKQLLEYGLRPCKDFFVWDESFLFSMDDNTRKFIEYFKQVWEPHRIEGKNTVLVPFDNYHISAIIRYAYMGNYLAYKNEANIMGYYRFGFDEENASPVIRKIYESFNVNKMVTVQYSDEMRREVDELVDSLWTTLYTWADWKKIHVYGIHFGTTILRDYFRRMTPTFDLRDRRMRDYLYYAMEIIVFWYRYFQNESISAVLLGDGTNWDGYIRDIAESFDIPAYAVNDKIGRLSVDYAELSMYQYFDKMWESLDNEEKRFGISWAKKRIDERINGNIQDVAVVDKKNFVFALEIDEKQYLEQNDKLKVMICPHSFEEDSYFYGEHIFDDNYFAWMCHLGELSKKLTQYDWYIKEHPTAKRRDGIILNMFLEHYPNIKKIPGNVSPLQLKKEGIQFAFTESGTIGHEYPVIGIQVINAGRNPHSCFDFCWNPQNKEDFDYLVYHLSELEHKTNMEELYKFYSLKYLYYDWEYLSVKKVFFNNHLLELSRNTLSALGYSTGTWLYKLYLEECTPATHINTWNKMSKLFEKMDMWRPDILYKKTM